jgi:hypothetical protein
VDARAGEARWTDQDGPACLGGEDRRARAQGAGRWSRAQPRGCGGYRAASLVGRSSTSPRPGPDRGPRRDPGVLARQSLVRPASRPISGGAHSFWALPTPPFWAPLRSLTQRMERPPRTTVAGRMGGKADVHRDRQVVRQHQRLRLHLARGRVAGRGRPCVGGRSGRDGGAAGRAETLLRPAPRPEHPHERGGRATRPGSRPGAAPLAARTAPRCTGYTDDVLVRWRRPPPRSTERPPG